MGVLREFELPHYMSAQSISNCQRCVRCSPVTINSSTSSRSTIVKDIADQIREPHAQAMTSAAARRTLQIINWPAIKRPAAQRN
jgi:hypothetical protein